MAPLDHIHISERESDGTWEDCTWDSGLEWYRLVYDARVPATHTEAQLLRMASGEPATGGSNLGNLADGIRRRYGKTVAARLRSFSELRAALTNNRVAVVQGSMRAFAPAHRLSKWQTNFDSSHAVVLINFGGKLLWCDPLAPTSAAVPVEVTWTEVKAYVSAFAGQHLVGPIKNIVAVPDTATEVAVGYNVKGPANGAFTFKVGGMYQPETDKVLAAAAGFVRTVYARVIVTTGRYTGKYGYLGNSGTEVVICFDTNGTYVERPAPPVDHTAAILADRAKARITYP